MELSPIPVSPPLLAECQKMPRSYGSKDRQGWEWPAGHWAFCWEPVWVCPGVCPTPLVGVWEASLKPDASEQAELQLNPGSSTKPSAGMIQFPCLGYLIPQIPHAENLHPDCKGVSRNFALTCTIMQLNSGYIQEFCSGINYNPTTVIWNKSGLACTLWCHSTGSNLEIQTQPSPSRAWGANQGEILQCMQHSCINQWEL